MSQPVTIENDALSFEVWPIIGGKVSSIIDKTDHQQLLFTYPAEIPSQGAQYDLPYQNSWYAGWDEIIPALAPCRYAGFPYEGTSVPDHGEIWGLPTTAVPTKNGITTVWHGLRFGYRLARKLYLEDSSIIAEYTLVNLAPFEFRFIWAQHALLAMNSPVELDLSGSSAMNFSHDAAGKRINKAFDWPKLGEDDLAHPKDLPANRGWKLFTADPIAAPAVIKYPKRNRQLTIEYSSEDSVPAYWGVWINTGGWCGHKHFALEPTTGRFDDLERAVADHSAGRIPPLSKRSWTVRWTVSATA
jgi:hypothetical protein